MKTLIRLLGFCAVAFAAIPATADNAVATSERIVVPAHDIMRGQVIGDGDLVYANIPSGSVLVPVATSMNQLVGREARRLLRANEAVRADDVRRPILVERGSTVTMTFEAPGLVLTATGKAMGEGGMGETVVVLNPVSYRQITGIVTGPGQVRAGVMTQVSPGQLASTRNDQETP